MIQQKSGTKPNTHVINWSSIWLSYLNGRFAVVAYFMALALISKHPRQKNVSK